MSPLYLLERTVEVHHRLLEGGIENAIGGGLALGYHVDDPRATRDIDVNISAPATRAREVLQLLPDDVPWDDEVVRAIERDDQVRIMWPAEGQVPLPLDLFFMADALHEQVRQRVIQVPMLGTTIAIVSATDLTVFKALFDRPKDWVDIQAMLDAHDSTVDLDRAASCVADVVGDDDPRVDRLRRLAD